MVDWLNPHDLSFDGPVCTLSTFSSVSTDSRYIYLNLCSYVHRNGNTFIFRRKMMMNFQVQHFVEC